MGREREMKERREREGGSEGKLRGRD